jgi:hypothetical protein
VGATALAQRWARKAVNSKTPQKNRYFNFRITGQRYDFVAFLHTIPNGFAIFASFNL